MGAPNLLADNEYGLSYSVVSYLKKLSQQVTASAGACVGQFSLSVPEWPRSHRKQ